MRREGVQLLVRGIVVMAQKGHILLPQNTIQRASAGIENVKGRMASLSLIFQIGF